MSNSSRTLLFAAVLAALAAPAMAGGGLDGDLPWREAGLNERQAAAHLLDRFAYGARPGQIDEVVELGLGNWIDGQLAGDLPGSVLEAKLSPMLATTMSQGEIKRRYSADRGRLAQEAIAAGVISRKDYSGELGMRNLRAAMAALDRFGAERGMQPQWELVEQLKAQKLLRAVYSQSQLVEVLTDFWFNHFNVSVTSDGRVHVFSYERDAIRPNVLASFRRLLGATARHPAMLLYLGNARSVAGAGVTTAFDLEIQELDRLSPGANPSLRQRLARRLGWFFRGRVSDPRSGLNENYARELLELHTLGVDGGYRQRDVIEVARAFTGWTTFPPGGLRSRIEEALVKEETAETARDMGFVVEDEFVFRADQHDAQTKTVLGVTLPADRGIEDGEDVLDLLSRHPSMRRHLARKLAVRFVSERPPAALIRRLEETWLLTGGDLAELVRTLVRSPEFWSDAARRCKIKTPFELVASALRALDAEISEAVALIRWIERMGQPVYAYSAPTGFPDRGDHWANVGPLLKRINFGTSLAAGKIPGAEIDLPRLLGRRRLESLEQAAEFYFPRLMPERDASATLRRISKEMIHEETISEERKAGSEPAPAPAGVEPQITSAAEKLAPGRALEGTKLTREYAVAAVGLLIGSPQFQVK